jgi:hypothetical protein
VVAVETGRQIGRHALQNFLRPVPNLSGATRLSASEFQLQIAPGPVSSYIVERSQDLRQWLPLQTNVYGTVLHSDTSVAGADRRFYRTTIVAH